MFFTTSGQFSFLPINSTTKTSLLFTKVAFQNLHFWLKPKSTIITFTQLLPVYVSTLLLKNKMTVVAACGYLQGLRPSPPNTDEWPHPWRPRSAQASGGWQWPSVRSQQSIRIIIDNKSIFIKGNRGINELNATYVPSILRCKSIIQ